MKYALDPHVILRSEPQYYNTYTAFHWERAETLFLQEEEYKALKLIYDEPRTVEAVSRSLNLSLDRVKTLYRDMMRKGFIRFKRADGPLRPPKRIKVDPRLFDKFQLPFPSAPTSLDLFLTNRCNLHCRHCFSSSGNGEEDLSFEQIHDLMDQLEGMGVFEVRLNGGEPFCHPMINEILNDVAQRRLRRVIITNGTLLNKESVNLLKHSKTIPTVSLDDSRPEGHDSFRAVKGAFKLTLKGMRLLKEEGVTYGVNTCIHRGNLERVGEIIELAAKYGASKIALLDLKEVGRMKNRSQLAPSPRDYRKAATGLRLLKQATKNIEVSLDLFTVCHPLKESTAELSRGYVSCSAGKTHLSIDSDGCVYPCNLVLSDGNWNMGDIKKSNLKDIWASEKWSFFRGGVELRELEYCGDCPALTDCTDLYCRLYPYTRNGDPYSLNPYCRRRN